MLKLCAMLLYDCIRDLSAPLCLKYYLVLKPFRILPGWRMMVPGSMLTKWQEPDLS
jgi:hypothetical protein